MYDSTYIPFKLMIFISILVYDCAQNDRMFWRRHPFDYAHRAVVDLSVYYCLFLVGTNIKITITTHIEDGNHGNEDISVQKSSLRSLSIRAVDAGRWGIVVAGIYITARSRWFSTVVCKIYPALSGNIIDIGR